MTEDEYKAIRKQANQIVELIDGIEELKKELQDAGKQMRGMLAQGIQDQENPEMQEKIRQHKSERAKTRIPGAMSKEQFMDSMLPGHNNGRICD